MPFSSRYFNTVKCKLQYSSVQIKIFFMEQSQSHSSLKTYNMTMFWVGLFLFQLFLSFID